MPDIRYIDPSCTVIMCALQQQGESSSDDGSEDGHVRQEDDFFCFGNFETAKRDSDTEMNMYLSDSSKDLGRLKKLYTSSETIF
jgi:hypothetical protein